MKRFLSLTLALLLLPLFQVMAEAQEPDQAGLQALFSGIFAKADPVGGVAMVARDGEIIFSLPYGRAGSGQAVTADTVFKVASATKLITAIGLLQLAEEGRVALDAPLSDVLGTPVLNPYFPDSPITLRQVMSHTSSISQSAVYAKAPKWPEITREDGYFNKTVPGAAYEYANLNGGILGGAHRAAVRPKPEQLHDAARVRPAWHQRRLQRRPAARFLLPFRHLPHQRGSLHDGRQLPEKRRRL